MLARRKSLGVNLALAAAGLAAAAVLGELLTRLAIALDVGSARNPRLYAGFCDDDDHWKLHYLWRRSGSDLWSGPLVFDPHLGWRARGPAFVPCDGCERPVVLYGDSFIHGVAPTPNRERIPKLLARAVSGRRVIDYAVPGYGLDQTVLRFQSTHMRYASPAVVFGITTLDLDRSVLTVRDAPKPYFVLRDGGVELRGVPLPRDSAAWYREHPPEIRSYLLAALIRWRRLSEAVYETEISYRRAEKTAINAAILEAVARVVAEHDHPFVAVLLYPPWELGFEGWRERFLKERLGRLGVPYLDTKPLLLERSDRPADELYHPPSNFHLNAEGNRIVARAIADWLAGTGGADRIGGMEPPS